MLGDLRKEYGLRVPKVLRSAVQLQEEAALPVDLEVRKAFPKSADQGVVRFAAGKKAPLALRVGVVLSGGQAPGGHNVIIGLLTLYPRGASFLVF